MSWLKRLKNSVFAYSKYRIPFVNLPDGKMQFYILPTLFMNAWSIAKYFHMVVLYDGRPLHVHTFSRFALVQSWVIFILKRKVSFLFRIFWHFVMQLYVNYLSRVMRKPDFCICENKDANQLRGNREADQRLCFRYTDSTIPLLPKYKMSSF